jgi:hypothetical protein
MGGAGGDLQLPGEMPPLPCDPPFPGLDPPCSEQDLHGTVLECLGSVSLSFQFPLTALTPPADNLRIVCLPLDGTLGIGGMGGAGGLDSAVVLEVDYLYPGSAGVLESESTFSLSKPARAVASHTNFTDGLPAECVENRGEYPDSYFFAEVAIAQGDTIVEQRRLLLHGSACVP